MFQTGFVIPGPRTKSEPTWVGLLKNVPPFILPASQKPGGGWSRAKDPAAQPLADIMLDPSPVPADQDDGV
jgi:hypothetical protein